MNIPFHLFLSDPVLVIALAVLITALVILIWAVKKVQDSPADADVLPIPYDEEDTEPAHESSTESSGLVAAHIREMSSQLTSFEQRLSAIEELLKAVREHQEKKPSFDATIQAPLQQIIPDFEKLVQRIDSRLELVSQDKSGINAEDLNRLETKLDTIRKLLMLLSDSSVTGE